MVLRLELLLLLLLLLRYHHYKAIEQGRCCTEEPLRRGVCVHVYQLQKLNLNQACGEVKTTSTTALVNKAAPV